MAYRRRYTTRRRPRRTRRMLMRRKPMRSLTMKRRMATHHFKRTFNGAQFNASNAGPAFAGYSFGLVSLPNYTEFTNLFDQYRINKVVIKFVPSANADEIGASKIIPSLHTVIDNNDNTAPTAMTELYEYQSYKRTQGIYTHTRVFTPSCNVDLSIGSSPKWKQWINSQFANVEHFGLKVGADQVAAAGDLYWRTFITLYFSCRSTK